MIGSERLGFPAVDADGHYYEPHDCFTRHIDPKFRERAVHVVKGVTEVGWSCVVSLSVLLSTAPRSQNFPLPRWSP